MVNEDTARRCLRALNEFVGLNKGPNFVQAVTVGDANRTLASFLARELVHSAGYVVPTNISLADYLVTVNADAPSVESHTSSIISTRKSANWGARAIGEIIITGIDAASLWVRVPGIRTMHPIPTWPHRDFCLWMTTRRSGKLCL
jgi:hypothetical protein